MSDVVDDTTPQLGGTLDVNGNNFSSAAGMDFAIGGAAGNDFTVDTNKLVVEGDTGRVGIGTTTPVNKLDVEGGAVIGATYSGTTTGPANGLWFKAESVLVLRQQVSKPNLALELLATLSIQLALLDTP